MIRKKRILDVTGTPLTPSPQGKNCLGNGEHPNFECCCDECDYYLRCFPQYTPSFLKNRTIYVPKPLSLRKKRRKYAPVFSKKGGKEFLSLKRKKPKKLSK